MSSFPGTSRFMSLVRGLWVALFLLAGLIGWRLQSLIWMHDPGAPALAVPDRRLHHFRDLTYTQTERLVQAWLRQAYRAATPREQGLALARVAILQRERGIDGAAQAAAQEAMKLSRNDPEVREILSRSLRPDEIRPPR